MSAVGKVVGPRVAATEMPGQANENTVSTMDDEEIIARGIVGDPTRRRVADARLRESGVPVWAIIGHWRAVGEDATRVIDDYEITQDEFDAARAYYRRHRAAIDARLVLNAG